MANNNQKKKKKINYKALIFKILHVIGYISTFIVLLCSVVMGVQSCKNTHVTNKQENQILRNSIQLNNSCEEYDNWIVDKELLNTNSSTPKYMPSHIGSDLGDSPNIQQICERLDGHDISLTYERLASYVKASTSYYSFVQSSTMRTLIFNFSNSNVTTYPNVITYRFTNDVLGIRYNQQDDTYNNQNDLRVHFAKLSYLYGLLGSNFKLNGNSAVASKCANNNYYILCPIGYVDNTRTAVRKAPNITSATYQNLVTTHPKDLTALNCTRTTNLSNINLFNDAHAHYIYTGNAFSDNEWYSYEMTPLFEFGATLSTLTYNLKFTENDTTYNENADNSYTYNLNGVDYTFYNTYAPTNDNTSADVYSVLTLLGYENVLTRVVVTNQNPLTSVFQLIALGFYSITPIFTIQLYQGLTIGMLIFLPLVITIIVFIIKALGK